MGKRNTKTFWSTADQRRFLSKVRCSEGCWEWQAYCLPGGYGQFSIAGQNVLAHRAVYDLLKGSVSDGAHVCHKCDNPKCCNPEHLFLGTQADNMADKIAKGRAACGAVLRTNSKLTEDAVREIRSLHGKVLQRELACRFGVSQATISEISSHKKWKQVV